MTLDQLLRDAGSELDRQSRRRIADGTAVVHEAARRPSPRRRLLLLSTAAVLTVGAAATVVTLGRDVDAPVEPLSTAPAADATGGLLAPGGPVVDGQVDAAIPGRFVGAVTSPAGEVFGIHVSEDFWGSLPPDWEQRTIGGRVFAGGQEMEQRTYVTLGPCAMVAIAAPGGAEAWSPSVLALLDSLGTTDSAGGATGAISIALPAGWQSLGAGPQTAAYRAAFDATVGGSTTRFVLFQQPSSSVAGFLAETHRGTPEPTTFDGRPAWFVRGTDDGNWTYLIWDNHGTATMLGAAGITDDTLATAAARLAPTTADRLRTMLSPKVDADEITPTTMATMPVSEPATCARSLTIGGR